MTELPIVTVRDCERCHGTHVATEQVAGTAATAATAGVLHRLPLGYDIDLIEVRLRGVCRRCSGASPMARLEAG